MRLQPRNIILGIPQVQKKKRLAQVVLNYKIPIAELRPKYLEKILKTILGTGADILTANRSGAGGVVYMTLFVDLDKTEISAEEIENRLKNLGFISEVSVFEPKPLLFDVAHFPLTNGVERVCVISTAALARMHEEMIRILGSGAFTVLWYIGLEKGKNLVKLIKNFASENKLNKKEMLAAFKQFYQAGGWGVIEYVDVNLRQGTGKIRIYNSIAESVTKKYDRPICYYTKGHLTALLQEIFEHKSIHIEEVKCMAIGDKFCEFEFSAS